MNDTASLIHAPPHWRTVDLISDLHLHPGDPATATAWRRYLDTPEVPDALFILGDLFEVWVGDDALDAPGSESEFLRAACAALRRFAARAPVYFLAGNRDFLLGQAACAAAGMRALPDPSALDFAGHRWLLSHGDALCLDDHDYQAFRATVRSAGWQQDFLGRPLAQRLAVARDLRAQSEARKQSLGHDPALWADVDASAARDALRAQGGTTLIHGHTHRPGDHDLGDGLRRVVLSDWDAGARPPRAQVLRLSPAGIARLDLPVEAA